VTFFVSYTPIHIAKFLLIGLEGQFADINCTWQQNSTSINGLITSEDIGIRLSTVTGTLMGDNSTSNSVSGCISLAHLRHLRN
jgi:hypothetical protein